MSEKCHLWHFSPLYRDGRWRVLCFTYRKTSQEAKSEQKWLLATFTTFS